MDVGTFQAKNQLSKLLDQVERGQRIYITRRGKRVAMLTSVPEPGESGGDSKDGDLLARFRAFRSAAKRGKESIRSLVEEGRR